MNNFEFLDIITVLSFVLQLQNQENIISIGDVQDEVNRAVAEIHRHLEAQDDKIDHILSLLEETK